MDKNKKKELIYRVIAGLVLIPCAVYLTLFADRFLFFLVMEIVTLLGVRELIPMVKKEGGFIQPPLIWAGGVSIPVVMYFGSLPVLVSIVFMLLFILFLLKMLSAEPTTRVLEDISLSFFSITFLPFLFSFFLMIRDIDPTWLVFLFFVIWMSDTCAYFTGISIGKRKLIPKVSPGKTIEGLVGGFLGALIMAFIWNYFLFNLNIFLMAMIAIDIIIAGVVGDLAESMIKRSAMVKDSGHLIPGHGGILDRFDSLIFAAPVLFFYLYFLVGSNG